MNVVIVIKSKLLKGWSRVWYKWGCQGWGWQGTGWGEGWWGPAAAALLLRLTIVDIAAACQPPPSPTIPRTPPLRRGTRSSSRTRTGLQGTLLMWYWGYLQSSSLLDVDKWGLYFHNLVERWSEALMWRGHILVLVS